MRSGHHLDVAGLSAVPRRHAVVVGGSLAGMLAARVLSDHFDAVTLLERDRFPETPAARKGLPQGRHAHALLERGREVMERLFPGLTGELVQSGAELLDTTQDFARMGSYGWYVRCPSDLLQVCSSRDLIDHVVRGRVAAIPSVTICQGVDVVGLIPGPGGAAAGVRLRARTADALVDRSGAEIPAELVVVADGRNSRLPDWLTALGYEAPQETVVNSFQGYASRIYRPSTSFNAGWRSLYIQQAPPGDPRGGLITPVEGGRWLVSLTGGDGDYPPTDEAGFLEFARGLRSPALYDAIVGAEPLTPIASQRATENRLRHYYRLGQFPEGLVALGDAVSAFNPVYGQGMSAAAIGAEMLDRWLLGEASLKGPGRGRAFQRHLARVTAAAWKLSAGADYRFRTTEGPPQGRIARLTGRYIDGLMRASMRRSWVRRRLAEVLHLIRPPAALFGPGVVIRLAWDRLASPSGARSRTVGPRREGDGGSGPLRVSTAPPRKGGWQHV